MMGDDDIDVFIARRGAPAGIVATARKHDGAAGGREGATIESRCASPDD